MRESDDEDECCKKCYTDVPVHEALEGKFECQSREERDHEGTREAMEDEHAGIEHRCEDEYGKRQIAADYSDVPDQSRVYHDDDEHDQSPERQERHNFWPN